MFDLATISRPYALAVFEYAKENKTLNEWSGFLQDLARFSQSSKNLVSYFESFSSQRSILTDTLVEALNIKDPAMIQFLKIIQQSKRLSCVNEITELFLALKRKSENTQRVKVISALALKENQTKELAHFLEQNLKKSIELSVEVDSELIGGFVIKIDDFVVDHSIKAKLNQMKNELLI